MEGKLVSGVQPGVYQARVVIADDEIDHKKLASKVLPKRYLNFDQSGWTIQVPSNDVRLELQTR